MENIKPINVDANEIYDELSDEAIERLMKMHPTRPFASCANVISTSGFEYVAINEDEDGTTTIETDRSIMTIGREGIHFKFKKQGE